MKITFTRILTFGKSLWWHIWLGFPKSSTAEINYRFTICKQCEFYEPINSQCLVCGCNLSDKKKFLNKLAWADQECPLGKWKKVK